MSKKKLATCIKCGEPIGRHKKRLEFRLGDRPIVSTVKVHRVLNWLPKFIGGAVDTMISNPNREKIHQIENDSRPKLFQCVRKCPGGKEIG